jgi:hypothetical protein
MELKKSCQIPFLFVTLGCFIQMLYYINNILIFFLTSHADHPYATNNSFFRVRPRKKRGEGIFLCLGREGSPPTVGEMIGDKERSADYNKKKAIKTKEV